MKRTFIVLCCSLLVLAGCGMSNEAVSVQETINKLPTSYSLDVDDAIKNAQDAYQALDDKQKKYIDAQKLDQLTNEQSSVMKQAESINNKIANLKIEVDDEIQIENTSDQMLVVSKEIESFPKDFDELIDYKQLWDKYQSFMIGMVEVSDEYGKDIAHIESALKINHDFIDSAKGWLYSNGSNGYISGMTDALDSCIDELSQVKRVDVSDANSKILILRKNVKSIRGIVDSEKVLESDLAVVEALGAASENGGKEAIAYNLSASGKSAPGLSRTEELLKDRGGYANQISQQ